jgi:hypothetical protein
MKVHNVKKRSQRPASRSIGVMLALLAPLALAGCVVGWDYEKPRTSPEQTRRDLGICGVEFNAAGRPIMTSEAHRNSVNRCMERRGYRVVRVGF